MAPHRWLIITLALGLFVALPTAEAQRRGKIPLVGVLLRPMRATSALPKTRHQFYGSPYATDDRIPYRHNL